MWGVRRRSFAGRVVIITGGSRGLGLVLARRFHSEGARVALLARNTGEVQRAAASLDSARRHVLPITCDVTQQHEVQGAVELVREAFGRIDVLINNAGVIHVGPLAQMTLADFEDAMAVHFWGALHTMQAVLPHMQKRRSGRIVNIASIGGLVAVPHLAPYVASKFALVGLSDAVRAEVRKDGIRVTTVCPGLMRTGSAIHAWMKGRHHAEYAWFGTLSALPVVAIHADRAARKIVDACRRGAAHLTITPQAQALALLDRVLPNTTAALIASANGLLPRPDGDAGYEARLGLISRPKGLPRWVTSLGEAAAIRNNELDFGPSQGATAASKHSGSSRR
jgi:NAD(P)-dependent dehydrogenase (short-subunit alcohol dehydrogenase family)